MGRIASRRCRLLASRRQQIELLGIDQRRHGHRDPLRARPRSGAFPRAQGFERGASLVGEGRPRLAEGGRTHVGRVTGDATPDFVNVATQITFDAPAESPWQQRGATTQSLSNRSRLA